ncbi:DinB family protein [Deinococcus planocerae]|uniref:DinB family protein n=1 Tax=Deinococcus planocerae TaxID=1737569 RepID=UPI000C7E8A69|nr:DinB family protein [Deinococcus planocerae]
MTALAFLARSLAHTEWGNHRVLRALRQTSTPPPQAVRLFAHLLAAEHVWLLRLRGEDARTTPIWPEWDLETCGERLPLNGLDYRAFLEVLTDARLDEVVTYPNSTGRVFHTPVGDILHHVFAHGAYHRGQIALIMRQAGLEPVNTDFITFVRETMPG